MSSSSDRVSLSDSGSERSRDNGSSRAINGQSLADFIVEFTDRGEEVKEQAKTITNW